MWNEIGGLRGLKVEAVSDARRSDRADMGRSSAAPVQRCDEERSRRAGLSVVRSGRTPAGRGRYRESD